MTDPFPIRVDIVSDVVCPWCAIGYRQLARAAEATGIPLELHWNPFELNPDMPPEGENLRAHVAAKYGTTPEASRQARDRLTELGASLGFTFDYADDMRMVNTFKAHRLIEWAGESGQAHATSLALMEAFFTRREDLNDTEVLARVAASLGLSPGNARAMLESGVNAALVREKERFWTSRGVSGVPTMIFARRHAVRGAQGEANYARILQHLSQEAA